MDYRILKATFIIVIPVFFLFVACRNNQGSQNTVAKPGKKDMTELNRYLVQKDREIIENYIERKNLKMTESPSGLWYSIINEGKGEYLKDNDRIRMEYECSLLDGTSCYSSSELGLKEIIIGKTEIETGMNEGLRLLKRGGEAVFILPPFLAYGLVGDGKKIPPRTTIVFNIRIIESR